MIEEIGYSKFVAVVTDNMNTMKAAWRQIESRFPHICAYGCAAHVTNLMIKDLSDQTQPSKTIKDSAKIIHFINNHHIAKAIFVANRKVCRVGIIKRVVDTRWFSLAESTKSILSAKYVLLDMIENDDEALKAINPKRVTDAFFKVMKSEAFWTNLNSYYNLIEFPSQVIGKKL